MREDPGRSGQNLGLGKFSDEVLNQNCIHQSTLQTQQLGIPPMSGTHTPACGNTGSFTHGARPGIKPASSQTRCQVLTPLSHHRNFSFTLSRWLPLSVACVIPSNCKSVVRCLPSTVKKTRLCLTPNERTPSINKGTDCGAQTSVRKGNKVHGIYQV